MARARNGSSPRLVTLTHVVKKGESLSLIAVKYGQPVGAWRELFKINESVIEKAQRERGKLNEDGSPNPDLIYPGMILRLPSSWAATQREEARVEVRLSSEGRRVAWIVGGFFALTILAVSAFSRRKKTRMRAAVTRAREREESAAVGRVIAPPIGEIKLGELNDLDTEQEE